MNSRKVLVTGGAGMIGAAVIRRLARDQALEIKVADHRTAPEWMRGLAELHSADLREPGSALAAAEGCSHIVHLAAIVGGIANFHKLPYTIIEANDTLTSAVVRAALERGVERLLYVSSSMVFEQATEFPTREEHLLACRAPRSAYGFSKLAGEVFMRAARDEHGLPYTICRPFTA